MTGQPLLRSRAVALWGVVILLVALPGCFSYQPLVGELPSPGEEIRVRLSSDLAVRMSERTGRPVRSLEGRVLAVNPDSLRLDVGWGAIYAGTRFEGQRDTLTFHERDILEVDRKEFSRSRTALVGAGFVAALVVLFESVRGGGEVREPGNGDPIPF